MTDTQRTTYAGMRQLVLSELARLHPSLLSRTTDDFTVAAVDAWAAAAEILGFDAARIHEESCIDLATEQQSIIELARLLGYRPDPGVAASASMVFTIDDSTGSWPEVSIPAGTPVSRTPPPGQPSYTFETVESIQARPAWNRIRPRLGAKQGVSASSTTILLAGTSTNVMPGDAILIPLSVGSFGPTSAALGIVTSVTVRPDDLPVAGQPQRAGWTTVTLDLLPGTHAWVGPFDDTWFGDPAIGAPLDALVQSGVTSLDDTQLLEYATTAKIDPADLAEALRDSRQAPGAVMVFRTQAGILGSGAPEWLSLPKSLRDDLTGQSSDLYEFTLRAASQQTPSATSSSMYTTQYFQDYFGLFTYVVWADQYLSDYPGISDPPGPENVFMDTVVRGLGPGICVLRDAGTWSIRQSTQVSVASKSVFTVSGRSTVLSLSAASGDNPQLSSFSIRRTSVHAAPEWLPLAPQPASTVLPSGSANSVIMLDDWYDGMTAGQRVFVTGGASATPSVTVNHVSKIRTVSHDLSRDGATSIDLVDPLPEDLLRESVMINANVALATHGETRSDILANADVRVAMPRFTLAASPLTYVTASGGSASTLSVYVNGLLRSEVPAVLDDGEQGYVVRQDETGVSKIQFGSALPTGQLNVRATYRVGLGTGADIGADQLTLMTRRPAGVRSVTNPLPAVGGADAESLDSARTNAPISVRTLGRIVSLTDYGDYARTFPGVAKASVIQANLGGLPGALVTVVGEDGATIEDGDDIHETLVGDLSGLGDPLVPLRVVPHRPRSFKVTVGLRIDPAYVTDTVVSAVTNALGVAFGFDARDLAQPVSASEVISVAQAVAGVRAAALSVLCRLDNGLPEEGVAYRPFLTSDIATVAGPNGLVGAELLILDPHLTTVEVLIG